MFNIPPVIGLLIALGVGIVTGGTGTHFYHEKQLAEANARQLQKDDRTAAKISRKTEKAKRDNEVAETIIEYRDKIVEVPLELTKDEIHNICINLYLPDDIMQSIRSEARKAWKRINGVQYDDAAGQP